jgi:gamma-glutamylcyclotransferase (GGCT)/AIG2-like uncharacterized protein YtfP
VTSSRGRLNAEGGPRLERLFVYGTLLAGEPNAARLRGCRLEEAHARLAGARLIDLGDWPGLLLADPGHESERGVVGERVVGESVVGEVWLVAARRFAALDEFEGVPDWYTRRVVTLEDGSTAWTYVWARATDAGPVIPGGDWHNRRR